MNPRSESAVRVLIVDDFEDMRFLVRWALERDPGFTVVAEAENGQDAVARAAEHQPDLVMLDIAMPVMDGVQALPRIREHAPDAVVVMLSTFAATDPRAEHALAAGAHGFLPKVKESHLLPDQVRKILAETASQRRAT